MLAESLIACQGRALIQQKVKHRASIVTLSMKGIDQQTIAFFAQTHQRTVHRWVCRIEKGGLLVDLARSGRPRKFLEAERLTTIAVYCQHAPPLAGVHMWSLRDAERYLKEHPEIVGEPISRSTIHRIQCEHALQPQRRKY